MAAGRKYRLSGIPMWMTVLAVIFSYPAFTFFVCPVNDHLLLQTRVVVCSVVDTSSRLDNIDFYFYAMFSTTSISTKADERPRFDGVSYHIFRHKKKKPTRKYVNFPPKK
jgi:hypothetical protein